MERFDTVVGAKGSFWSFAGGKRAGFHPQGAVIRVVENNQHGKVLQAGQ